MRLADDLRSALGDGVDTSSDAIATCAVDDVLPGAVVTPRSRADVATIVAIVESSSAAIIPVGGRTHLEQGNPPRRFDVALSTAGLSRIVKHDAADMTVTVEAGVTLAELAGVLHGACQWLPLDPARPARATVGGLVAADATGGLRSSHGKVRDYLLGMRAVIGGGTFLRGGGEVVKNVAGYDLPKLFAGSFGSLGVIVEATLKVRPLPEAQAWLSIACGGLVEAGERSLGVIEGPLAPYAVDVCDGATAGDWGMPAKPHVIVRLGGEESEVLEQRDRLVRLWPGWQELPAGAVDACRDFSAAGDVVVRVSCLPGDLPTVLASIEKEAPAFGARVALVAHAGSGVLRLRVDAEAPLPFLRWLRFAATRGGGHAFIERLPAALKREIDVWGESPAPALLAHVKQALDPKGTFSPGRFAGGL